MASLHVRGLRRTLAGTPLMPLLDFDASPGTVTFITGPSGIGKSTALRAIANLDPPDTSKTSTGASVVSFGALTPRADPPRWRASVSYVQQARFALTGSPSDLIKAARGFAVRSAADAESSQSATDGVEDAPFFGLIDVMGLTKGQARQDWSELSGGQAQRAALAVAMALRPDVLLLDEVTSACDKASSERVERAIVRQCAELDTIVIWVSHDGQQPGRIRDLGVPVKIVDLAMVGLREMGTVSADHN
jgi:ABC-type iron transport system FetAB ATPase subunit